MLSFTSKNFEKFVIGQLLIFTFIKYIKLKKRFFKEKTQKLFEIERYNSTRYLNDF